MRLMSNVAVVHFDEAVTSTQDEMKRLLDDESFSELNHAIEFLAVTAREQTHGRGTSGRTWMGQPGNLFLTVALPMSQVPVLLTLLPLQVGVVLATVLQKLMRQACGGESSSSTLAVEPKLKWPNDVLLDGNKVAGVLIESHLSKPRGVQYFLVGMGVNLVGAPHIPSEGLERGRPATCVQYYCRDPLPETTASVLAEEIAHQLVHWLTDPNTSAEMTLENWKQWAQFHSPQSVRETNEVVIPLDIASDGQLRVRGEDGRERLLMVDYLY